MIDEADVAAIADHILELSSAAGNPDCTRDGAIDTLDVICAVNVAERPPPAITGFFPDTTTIGTLVTIQGSNFLSPTGLAIEILLSKQGGGTIPASLASFDDLTARITVPTTATTGPITVNVPGKPGAVSAQDLTIVPVSDFTLAVGPVSANVIQGQQVSYAVTLNTDNGFPLLAPLTASGLPAGLEASFQPALLGAGNTSILTITAQPGQTPGTFPFTISSMAEVDGFDVSDSVSVNIIVGPVTTSFLGRTVVADTLQTPLAGVTVTLLGVDGSGNPTACADTTVSDAAGNFALTNLPAGCIGGQLIRFDGTTATSPPGDYAGVDLFYDLAPNQVTASPVLVHLPRIDNVERVCVDQGSLVDQTFTLQTIPDLSIIVYAGTTFSPPAPDQRGCGPTQFPLTAVQVAVDRLPEEMPASTTTVMPFIVAFQPANTEASEPVPVFFPNLLNTPPGTNMELSTLDPTQGVMVTYGTGTVSADGRQIIPDFDPMNPGKRFGLVHFDWHGAVVPPPPDNQDNPTAACSGPSTQKPVDLSSGIEVIRNTDILISGLRGAISIQRVYRTLSLQQGPFGVGSSHNYEFRLDTNSPQTVALINLVTPDGNRFPFALNVSGTYTNNTICKLRGAVLTVAGTGESNLRWKNGAVYHFTPSTALLGSLLETITDANGNVVTLTRNPSNAAQITEIIDPVGRRLTLGYDGASRITLVTDPLGRRVEYTYNAFGTLETVTDPIGGITRYDYSAADRLTQVTDARGVVVMQNAYNTDGRVIQQTQADTGALNIAYTLANPAAGAASPVLSSTVTDPLGHQTTYRFNPAGYVIDVTDALGQVRIFDREPGTNLLLSLSGPGQCDVCGDPADGDLSFTYDANGNRLTRTDALGNTTTFTYDPVFNKLGSVTDPLSDTTSLTYDASGNLLTIADARSNITTFTYDGNGLALTVTDPLSAQSSMTYDAFGNLVGIEDPLANVDQVLYDRVSRPIEFTDALGRRTTVDYDALDRIVGITDARGSTTQVTHDAISNLLTVTDARNNPTSFTYDAVGRLETRTDSSANTDTRVYDLNGNLTNFTDRRGQTSTFTYDALNRLVGDLYDDGSNVTRSYDANGRLIQTSDSISCSFGKAYDSAGRLLSESGPHGTVTYIRDELGRVSQRQVLGQDPVAYTYDAARNLESVSSPAASVTYAYDNRNQVSNESRSNGVDTNYTYDPLGRVLTLTHSSGPTELDSQSYVYDAVGNTIQKTVDVAQPLTTLPSINDYDVLSNRLTQWGVRFYTHDDNGNRLTETGPNGTTTYAWDARNRLRSLTQPTGETKTFEYDHAGNLIEEATLGTGPPSSRIYVLDDLTNVIQLKESSGQKLSVLTGPRIDQHLAVADSAGSSNFGLTDPINSTTQIVDNSGTPQDQAFYEPFGETSSTGGAYPFQFTGRVHVSDSIYHYRARFYDSLAGRFISEDPIGFGGRDINLYRYTLNSPVNSSDPLGLLSLSGEDADNLSILIKQGFDSTREIVLDLFEQTGKQIIKIRELGRLRTGLGNFKLLIKTLGRISRASTVNEVIEISINFHQIHLLLRELDDIRANNMAVLANRRAKEERRFAESMMCLSR